MAAVGRFSCVNLKGEMQKETYALTEILNKRSPNEQTKHGEREKIKMYLAPSLTQKDEISIPSGKYA